MYEKVWIERRVAGVGGDVHGQAVQSNTVLFLIMVSFEKSLTK